MFDKRDGRSVVDEAAGAPPGPELIAALAGVDPAGLSEARKAAYLIAWERQAAWVAACCAAAVTAVAEQVRALEQVQPSGDGELGERSLRWEVATALRVSDAVAGSRVEMADALSGRLAMLAAALRAGSISYWHASAIVDATRSLKDAQAVWVAERVLPRAATQTVAQLRASLRRAVIRVDPDRARREVEQARAEQDVDWWPLPGGQAELRVKADAADVLAVQQAVNAVADRLGLSDRAAGVERTAGQRRVAALVALVTGAVTPTDGERGGHPVTVNVTMDLPTALGLQDNPAQLAGYGPVPPSMARELAANGSWRRLIHEPLTGRLLDLGSRRYRPSARLAEHVRMRDMTCVFPGCSRRPIAATSTTPCRTAPTARAGRPIGTTCTRSVRRTTGSSTSPAGHWLPTAPARSSGPARSGGCCPSRPMTTPPTRSPFLSPALKVIRAGGIATSQRTSSIASPTSPTIPTQANPADTTRSPWLLDDADRDDCQRAANARSSYLSTLPVALRGRASTTRTVRGTL